MNIFAPAGTIKLAVTTSSGAAKLVNPNPQSVMVYNNGAVIAFIKGGDSTVTAAVTDLPIPPATVMVLDMKAAYASGMLTHIAAITASGSADVYFTTGQGVWR